MVDREEQTEVENSQSAAEPSSSVNGGDIAETDVDGSGNVQTSENVTEEKLQVTFEDTGNAMERNDQMQLDNETAADSDIRFRLPNSSLGIHQS